METVGENLLLNDTYVNTLAEALSEASSIANVPGLLKQIISNDMWRKRYCKKIRRDVEFNRFTDFVAAHPPEGLGTNMQVLMSICKHSGDMEALDALAQVEAGRKGNPTGANQYTSGNVDNINISTQAQRPTGTSAAATMRRLAKDVPTIHAKVIAGELSPNAAAIEAGFRKPKFQLPSEARQAGRYLAERVDKDWIMDMFDEFMKAIGE